MNIRVEQILADSGGSADALALKVHILEQKIARLREMPPQPTVTKLLDAVEEIALRPKQTNRAVVTVWESQWRHLRDAYAAWNGELAGLEVQS